MTVVRRILLLAAISTAGMRYWRRWPLFRAGRATHRGAPPHRRCGAGPGRGRGRHRGPSRVVPRPWTPAPPCPPVRRDRPGAEPASARWRRPWSRPAARAAAPQPGGEVRRRHGLGRPRALRVGRQLGDQHRQRLLRRAAVQPAAPGTGTAAAIRGVPAPSHARASRSPSPSGFAPPGATRRGRPVAPSSACPDGVVGVVHPACGSIGACSSRSGSDTSCSRSATSIDPSRSTVTSLGFRVASEMSNVMIFLTATGENHHDLALLRVGDSAPSPVPTAVGLYHVAVQLADCEAVRARACACSPSAGC